MLRLIVAWAALGAATGCQKADSGAANPNPSWCQRDYPPLTGRVVDSAGMLSDAEEQSMTAQLSAIERATAHQVVVATVPTTGGKDIVEYSTCLGRHWGIGRRGKNDGVIILLARDDRKVRIAVGYSLERQLTDPEAQGVINHAMLPAFENQRFADGLSRGIAAIGREIGMP